MSEADLCFLREDELPLGLIRMKLSLSCPSEVGVVGCSAWCGLLYRLQHLPADSGTAPAWGNDNMFREAKAIDVTRNTFFFPNMIDAMLFRKSGWRRQWFHWWKGRKPTVLHMSLHQAFGLNYRWLTGLAFQLSHTWVRDFPAWRLHFHMALFHCVLVKAKWLNTDKVLRMTFGM